MSDQILDLTSPETLQLIEKVIEELKDEYQEVQGLILNENDLQCLIYQKLYVRFSQTQSTADTGITAIALHTEGPWYNKDGKLTIRPDITILDPQKMSIIHATSSKYEEGKYVYNRLPSKGLEFGGSAIIIELKFVRSEKGILDRDIKKFEADITKILGLITRYDQPEIDKKVSGIMVIFNKTNECLPSFNGFLAQYDEHPHLKVIYCTGHVNFSQYSRLPSD